ncbi:GNAT family N-acetyltransferase [Neptunitalea lumnitzerae]|uniref:GNAT family N-acetyltransferase n=1 Tax=Neptunitalea lumnitzerae TaxID=2965509 RepID=A0ABQ5MKS4_9FLAO|nr:GNAT family N-acetyltransferase [Neptunitalea sp. Y10]GLB50010.1 hypothetical protein Y10_23780 [Neptunitalea sp. Y10]
MEYHSDMFTDFSLLVFKEDKLVAVLPANIKDGVVYSHQGLTYGGLFTNFPIKLEDYITIFYDILQFLKEQHVKNLVIKKIPSIYCTTSNEALEYVLFILQANLLKTETLTSIDRGLDLPFSRSRVNGNKRGIKNALTIKEDEDFEMFWKQILEPNLQHRFQTLPVHSLDEMRLLKTRFPENIKQFNVFKEANLVAGTTLFITDDVIHCQYISGDEDRNKNGSLDFLFTNLVKDLFPDKRYFDFGTSNENNGKSINKGLQYWKEGFGGQTYVQNVYEINVNNLDLLNSIYD